MEAARRVVEHPTSHLPLRPYLPQYYLLQKTSKEGFAPATSGSVLARTLSMAAWANGAQPRDASAPGRRARNINAAAALGRRRAGQARRPAASHRRSATARRRGN